MFEMETRLGRVKGGLGPRAADLTDRSPWDWYAESCSCGLPPGDCRASPSPDQPAATRGRLAGLGVGAGVRLAVRRPVAAAPGFGRARDPRPAA